MRWELHVPFSVLASGCSTFTFNFFVVYVERKIFSQVDGMLELVASGWIFHIQCLSLAQTNYDFQ